jgi:hypothetical protein
VRLFVAVLCIALGGLGAALMASARQAPAAAEGAPIPVRQDFGERDAPMPVLSDTPEYCATLENRVRRQRNRPPEVEELLREGHLLCDHGQVREGIAQLRRALLMLKQRGPVLIMP